MILLLIFWTYYFCLFSLIGLSTFDLINKILNRKEKQFSIVYTFFIGLASLLTILEIASLFMPINWHMHLFVFILTLTYTIYNYSRTHSYFKKKTIKVFSNKYNLFGLLILFVFLIFHASDGPVYNLDPARYHFQIINWAKSFSAVPGLANLHDRFGAIGSWHLLHAFSEFSYASDITYHIFNGLALFVLFAKLLYSASSYLKLKSLNYVLCFELIVLIVLLYYLNFIQYWFLSCPSPDLPNIIICIICFSYAFTYQKEIRKKNVFHIVALSLLCFSGFSIKLSALFLCFLLVMPVLDLIIKYKESKKALVLIVALFCFTYGTHLIKNTIVSGWPLYPVTMINFGSFDWQYPKEKADGWSACISHDAFAPEKMQNIAPYLGYEKKTKKEMFLIWFKREIKQRGYIFYILTFFIASICFLLFFKKKVYPVLLENRYIIISIFICFGFWITNAPDIRFGLGYLAILFGVLAVPLLYALDHRYIKFLMFFIVIGLSFQSFIRSTPISISKLKLNYPVAVFKHVFNTNELLSLRGIPKTKYKKHFVSNNLSINYSVWDTSYGSYGRNEPFYLNHYKLDEINADSLTKEKMFNHNNSNLLDWNTPLPASHTVYDELELRTDNIRDGFRFNRSKTPK